MGLADAKFPTLRRVIYTGATILTIIAICIVLLEIFFQGSWTRDEAHKEVLQCFQMLELDMDAKTVDSLFVQSHFKHLELVKFKEDDWEIHTPFEFGAVNWDLLISLEGRKVQSLKIRLADSAKMHPVEAPPDKVK